MEELAWFIVGCTFSFLILPVCAAYLSGDKFIEYKLAWAIGNGLALFFAGLFFGVAVIGWAFKTVFG